MVGGVRLGCVELNGAGLGRAGFGWVGRSGLGPRVCVCWGCLLLVRCWLSLLLLLLYEEGLADAKIRPQVQKTLDGATDLSHHGCRPTG